MIRRLLRWRGIVPSPLFNLLTHFCWSYFWQRERLVQAELLGETVPDLRGSERACLIESIAEWYPFSRILEVGCAYGQNFHIVAPMFPDVAFVGIDNTEECIAEGSKLFAAQGIDNVRLLRGDVCDLSEYPSGSFDVVYSSACFLYIAPDDVARALSEMCRVGKRAVLLLEQHREREGEYDTWHVERGDERGSYWIRDYVSALSSIVSRDRISVFKVPAAQWSGEQWPQYAHIIEIRLS